MKSTNPTFRRRADAGLSQAALARKAGVHTDSIRRLETSDGIQRITKSRACVARALGCKVSDLLPAPVTPPVDSLSVVAGAFGIDAAELQEGTTERAKLVREQLRLLKEAVKEYDGPKNVELHVNHKALERDARKNLAPVGRSSDD
jgi:transcriptional regulator with XRE-family HTH domain